MVKKLFALASVTALTGLVSAVSAAGCTTTETVNNAGGDGGTAGDSSTTKKDGSTKPGDSEEPEEEEPVSCAQKDPVDLDAIPYAKAKKVAGACTKDESDAIKKFLDDAIKANKFDFKQSDWAAVVSAGCASCVFTKEDDAQWGVIISKADDADAFLTYNRGGCVEIQSNNTECGKAYQHFQSCAVEACGSTCKTQEDFDACLDDETLYTEGACKDAIPAVQKACGANVGAYETACKGGLPAFINAHCIAPKGVDAGDGG